MVAGDTSSWAAIDTFKQASSLGFEIPDGLDIQFGQGRERDSLRKWRNAQCSSSTSTVDLSKLKKSFESVADKNLIAGANKCFDTCRLGQGGLFCNITDVDDTRSLVTVNWSPKDNNLTFPRITGGEIVGGEIVREGFGSFPFEKDTEITVTGISATIRRNDATFPISLNLVTDNGACAVVSEPLNRRIEVSAVISASGKRRVSQRKSSGRLAWGNDNSCTEGWTQTSRTVCLDAGVATSAAPTIHSANNIGRTWHELGKPSASCAIFHYGYSDRGRQLGNCKGNGWIDATWELRGYKLVNSSNPPYKGSDAVSAAFDATTTVNFTPPPSISQGLESVQWAFDVTIRTVVKGVEKSKFSLSPQVPELNGGKVVTGNSGAITVVISPTN